MIAPAALIVVFILLLRYFEVQFCGIANSTINNAAFNAEHRRSIGMCFPCYFSESDQAVFYVLKYLLWRFVQQFSYHRIQTWNDLNLVPWLPLTTGDN